MNRRGFLGLTAAFAAAGCTTTETKKVDAVTRATPVVPWKPFPNAKKVRVVQWGMCHEHADGKFKSVKKLPSLKVDADACRGCKACMGLGCPAISFRDKKAVIDETLCVGCGVCRQKCAFGAIG